MIEHSVMINGIHVDAVYSEHAVSEIFHCILILIVKK